jgi:hypothetical protein
MKSRPELNGCGGKIIGSFNITDLKSRPELNGCSGKIIGSFNAESGCWPVKVIPKTGPYEDLLLKAANIVPRTQKFSKSDVGARKISVGQ